MCNVWYYTAFLKARTYRSTPYKDIFIYHLYSLPRAISRFVSEKCKLISSAISIRNTILTIIQVDIGGAGLYLPLGLQKGFNRFSFWSNQRISSKPIIQVSIARYQKCMIIIFDPYSTLFLQNHLWLFQPFLIDG